MAEEEGTYILNLKLEEEEEEKGEVDEQSAVIIIKQITVDLSSIIHRD